MRPELAAAVAARDYRDLPDELPSGVYYAAEAALDAALRDAGRSG